MYLIKHHNITERVEDLDIKRFKQEVADYLQMDITYANMEGWEDKDPIDVALEAGGFKFGNNTVCTNRMKTRPFKKWLKENFPVQRGQVREDVIFYYGFTRDEATRITRRLGIMHAMGYKTAFPLASWKSNERTIYNTEEIGIKRPNTYFKYRHANCVGCLKSGRQSWFVVFCTDRDLFEKAKRAEEVIGYSILKDTYLSELECKFENMKALGIEPTEKVGFQRFWAEVNKVFNDNDVLPCECAV